MEEDEELLTEENVPARPPATQTTIIIDINNNISPIRVKIDNIQEDPNPDYQGLVDLTKRVATNSDDFTSREVIGFLLARPYCI